MNNLNFHQPTFNFLLKKSQKTTNSSSNCNLAWCYDNFHLQGNNYYLYQCHSCSEIQIKKGQPAKEILNWGGIHE